MRSIIQTSEPAQSKKWKRENKSNPQNLTYKNLPTEVKIAIKQGLLKEQGEICGYTMCRLGDIESSHLEHIEPQNISPEKALNYSNMLACTPKDGGDISLGYGAPIKGGTSVEINVDFVSPHSKGCEKRFHFDSNGKIYPASGDIAARATISLLQLDNPVLTELRQAALAAHGLKLSQRNLRTRTPRLTASEASQLAARIVKPLVGSTQLEPFCVAIAEVAKCYANEEKSRSKRMRKQKRQR